jgi:hypothetical protein
LSRVYVAPIVEGHGDVEAVRILLRRVWAHFVGGDILEVLPPARIPKSKLVQRQELIKAVDIACVNASRIPRGERWFILILFDADEDCPATLAGSLREALTSERGHLDIALVIANVEFETWFVAAAESLQRYFNLTGSARTDDPEGSRQGKGAVQWLMGGHYGERADQPSLAAAFDLQLCRSRSPSFDKLCRELERRKSP